MSHSDGLRRKGLWWVVLCVGVLWGVLQGCGSGERVPAEEAKRIRAIFERGLSHEDPYVRAEAIRAIGLTDAPEFKDLLIRGLKDKDLMVRAGSLLYLSAHESDDLGAGLSDLATASDQRPCRAVIAGVLSRLPFGDARMTFVDLSLRSSDAKVRQTALSLGLALDLKRVKDETIREQKLLPMLSRAVDSDDLQLAGRALRLMEASGRDDRATPFFKAAESGSLKARKRALSVLAEAGVPEYLPRLNALSMREDFPEGARGELSIARAACGDGSAIPGVREALVGAKPEALMTSIRALSRCEGSDAYRLLRSHRGDSRVDVRETLFEVLGEHKSVEGSDFGQGLRDHEPRVVVASIKGLAKASPRHLGPYLEKGLKKRGEALKLSASILTALDELEAAGEMKARGDLLEALSESASRLKTLAEDDKDVEVRVAAGEVMFQSTQTPMALHQSMKQASVEVTWTLLDALAQSPLTKDPLASLALFQRHQQSQHLATALISSTGVWRAYMSATENRE